MNTLDHPYHFDSLGRTAGTARDDHIRDLIEQVLFTAPGERVMRPDFGSGLLALVFEPNSSTLANLIAVQGVDVRNDDGALRVDVRYVVLADRSVQSASFGLPAGAGVA